MLLNEAYSYKVLGVWKKLWTSAKFLQQNNQL